MSQGIHKPLVHRIFAPIAAATFLAFALLVVPASPASAHDELIGSSPAADAEVDALPAELTLSFSDAISTDEGASEVQVTDAAGTTLTAGAPTAQDNVLTQPLEGAASGAVTVLWKVVSSDGHPISGEFAFTVTPSTTPTPTPTSSATTTPTPTETAEPTATPSATPGEPASDAGSSAVPWIVFGILAVAVAGAVVYLLVSRARREKELADNRERALGGTPGADSEPPAEG